MASKKVNTQVNESEVNESQFFNGDYNNLKECIADFRKLYGNDFKEVSKQIKDHYGICIYPAEFNETKPDNGKLRGSSTLNRNSSEFSEKFESIKYFDIKIEKVFVNLRSTLDLDSNVIKLSATAGKKLVTILEITLDLNECIMSSKKYANNVIDGDMILTAVKTICNDQNKAVSAIKSGYDPSDVMALWLSGLKAKSKLIDRDNGIREFFIPLANMSHLLELSRITLETYKDIDSRCEYWLETANELKDHLAEFGNDVQLAGISNQDND